MEEIINNSTNWRATKTSSQSNTKIIYEEAQGPYFTVTGRDMVLGRLRGVEPPC